MKFSCNNFDLNDGTQNLITFIVYKTKVESDTRSHSSGEGGIVALPESTVDFLQVDAGSSPKLHRERKKIL